MFRYPLSPVLFMFFIFALFTRKSVVAGEDESGTCVSGINMFENGDFKLVFNENEGEDISRYNALSTMSGESQLWLLYSPTANGELTFNANVNDGSLKMSIFKAERGNVCGELKTGLAKIMRMHNKPGSKLVGLDFKIDEGILYALELKEGDQIAILLTSEVDKKKDLFLSWNFIQKEAIQETKVVDRRNDDNKPTQSFVVRDKYTKKPIISNFAMEGTSDSDGLYIGSEFYFNFERNSKVTVKCDAEGYFYYDSLYTMNVSEDNEILIELERIAKGKSVSIQTIEFFPGGSEIKPTSYGDLKRLRDFLALNSEVHIEIQGHVFALGDNSLAAQRVSEARAKRVMKYLIDHGIDKERLTAVGYGNSRPIYEKPKFFYEEQANRRVEIVIQ